MNAYIKALKNIFNFKDRSSRKDLSLFIVMNLVVTIIFAVIDALAGTMGLITGAYGLFSIIPSISITIRRLHDMNKSGWYTLVMFIPVIGLLFLVYVLFAKTVIEGNQRGELI